MRVTAAHGMKGRRCRRWNGRWRYSTVIAAHNEREGSNRKDKWRLEGWRIELVRPDRLQRGLLVVGRWRGERERYRLSEEGEGRGYQVSEQGRGYRVSEEGEGPEGPKWAGHEWLLSNVPRAARKRRTLLNGCLNSAKFVLPHTFMAPNLTVPNNKYSTNSFGRISCCRSIQVQTSTMKLYGQSRTKIS